MTVRFFVALVGAVSTVGCLSAVPEQPCRDGGCTVDGGAGGSGGGQSDSGAVGGGTGGAPGGGNGGGSAGGAGGRGGGMAVDAGCGCTNFLGCQVGDSPTACGSNAAACATCGAGQQCISGQCMAGTCSPTTCSGCCAQNFCATAENQTALACGKGGLACSTCPMGQNCINGACSVQVCDVTTCATGCCFQSQCFTMQTSFACGTGGAACVQCGGGTSCSAGVCAVSDAGFQDGGVAIGGPCTSSAQCRPPQNAFCLPENPTGFPGGLCTAQCGAMSPCATGECVTETVFGSAQSSCRASCASPGSGQSTCRLGYVCVGIAAGGTGYCRPTCSGGGLAACPNGQQCGDAGYCN